MNVWVWVLTYTILGAAPEHGTISKFQTQSECQMALQSLKEERKLRKQAVVGSCHRVLKSPAT